MKRFALPSGTSSLTAYPWDNFEAISGWTELAHVEVAADADGFWHCIEQWTHERHWNRSIWKIELISQAMVSHASMPLDHDHTICPSIPLDSTLKSSSLENFLRPPPAKMRWIGLRELYRKSAAPVGGGEDGNGPSHTVYEWTTQYAWENQRKHVAVFGLCIPETARRDGNSRAMTYWPFQYPKVRAFSISFEPDESKIANSETGSHEKSSGVLRYCVLPLSQDICPNISFEDTRAHASKSAVRLLSQCRKRAEKYDPSHGTSLYVKRVNHDKFVAEEHYRKHYDRLKENYGLYWAANWPECTDPVKYVYEELAIAAYLLALFERERTGGQPKQSFIDLGCGNGFLSYLLMEEGHPGKGIDLQKRGIWDMYPERVSQNLERLSIDPEQFACNDVDWIIGNHSDELTPWIPAIAARSQTVRSTDDSRLPSDVVRPKFFVLPCCFYDFDGRKFAFGNTRRTLAVRDSGEGKYLQYLKYIERICMAFGFCVHDIVERENLRIPSTKNIALLGRSIQYPERITPDVINETVKYAKWDAQMSRN